MNWKRNTALAFVGVAAISVYTVVKSLQFERRYRPGSVPVPSQSWAAHTLVDDPDYHHKVAEYEKNKKPLSQRIFQTKEDFNEE